MIRITAEGRSGELLQPYGYVQTRSLASVPILSLTRWLRAINAERYMDAGRRHLDIGCGDGYFLMRSNYRERYGLDKLLGDEVTDSVDFPDDYFDLVTMLAVIEHVRQPRRLVDEVARLLEPGGKLIMTTPKPAADWFVNLYVRGIEEEHETHFDLDSMTALCRPRFDLVGHHTFIFGLNQGFCFRKRREPCDAAGN